MSADSEPPSLSLSRAMHELTVSIEDCEMTKNGDSLSSNIGLSVVSLRWVWRDNFALQSDEHELVGEKRWSWHGIPRNVENHSANMSQVGVKIKVIKVWMEGFV